MVQYNNKIKILFVDDEQIMREGMQLMVEWENYGFDVIGSSSNGEGALTICKSNMPDLVFTDIRMPIMDGLELTKKLSEINPNIKIIILSAYDDFKYAQKAIKYGASEYMLKAELECEDLLRVALKYSEIILKERSQLSESEVMLQQISNHMYELQNNLIWKLLVQVTHPSEISRQMLDFGIRLKEKNILLIHICGDINKSIKKIKNEIETHFFNYYYIKSSNAHHIIICNYNDNNQINDYLTDIYFLLKDKENKEVIISYTYIGDDFSNIYKLNRSLQEYIKACMFYSREGVFLFVEKEDELIDVPISDILKKSMGFIDNSQMQSFIKYLYSLFENFENIFYRPNEIREIILVLCTLLYEKAKEQENLSINKADEIINEFTDNISLKKYLFKYKSLKSLIYTSRQLCSQLVNYIIENQYNYSDLIRKSIEYIHKHLDNDLKLATISEQIHCNPAYLSQLFKKEMGENFSDYLMRTRIRMAQNLLRTTTLSIGEIAGNVGIPNFSYFSSVFSKVVGISPKQYRVNISKKL